MRPATWSFLIVAGGSGSRLGGEPKQFRMLGSAPVWKWSARIAEKLRRGGHITEIVLVLPGEHMEKAVRERGFEMPLHIAEGGRTRTESVLNGLKKCSGSHVLVHDGARPFITETLCLVLMEQALATGCAVPALPIRDSIRLCTERTNEAAPRDRFFMIQTPQAFVREALIDVIEKSGEAATDEATQWERAGNKVTLIEGDRRNFKITDQFDWDAAQVIVASKREIRTGHGYDVHRLVAGRKLILAGVRIENDVGLLGHSDADIVAHTVMDAILGAAGEPDIGTLFPASDQKWKNVDSTELLKEVLLRVRSEGWRVDWVDLTLEAQKPRLGHRVPDLIANLQPLLQESEGKPNFNMKTKSSEECGSVGRGECMVCHAVATLSRYSG